jgi:hypothetical protein
MTRKEECPKKIALLQEVQKAMGVLMEIHNEEVSMLLKEDFKELIRLRRKLAAARDVKANAIDRYRDHVISHEC